MLLVEQRHALRPFIYVIIVVATTYQTGEALVVLASVGGVLLDRYLHDHVYRAFFAVTMQRCGL